MEHDIKILAYGVLAGGFLTDRWLGVPRPEAEVRGDQGLELTYSVRHNMTCLVHVPVSCSIHVHVNVTCKEHSIPHPHTHAHTHTQDLANRSLVKYLLIIDEFGGWGLFQELLQTLQSIANRHSSNDSTVTIAMVAIQYVLQQEAVGGVIIGAHNNRSASTGSCQC